MLNQSSEQFLFVCIFVELIKILVQTQKYIFGFFLKSIFNVTKQQSLSLTWYAKQSNCVIEINKQTRKQQPITIIMRPNQIHRYPFQLRPCLQVIHALMIKAYRVFALARDFDQHVDLSSVVFLSNASLVIVLMSL